MTLGHAPVHLPWVAFLVIPALVGLLATSNTGRQAAWIGWAAGFGYFVSGLHWIGHAFLVDPERFLWLLPFAVTLLPAGLALFWALAFWAARAISP
ncbi:MAG: apolipoprotein N-acyltransferase, partial [Pseudomonadota bacterium]